MDDFSDKRVEEMLDSSLTKIEITVRKLGSVKHRGTPTKILSREFDMTKIFNKIQACIDVLPRRRARSWNTVDSCNLIQARELMTGSGYVLKIILEKLKREYEKYLKQMTRGMNKEAAPKIPETGVNVDMPDPIKRSKLLKTFSLSSTPEGRKLITMEEELPLETPPPEMLDGIEDMLAEYDDDWEAMLDAILGSAREPRGYEPERRSTALEETSRPSLRQTTGDRLLEQFPPMGRPEEELMSLEVIHSTIAPPELLQPDSNELEQLPPVELQQPAPIEQLPIPEIQIAFPSGYGVFKEPQVRPRRVVRVSSGDNVFSKMKIRRNQADLLKLLLAPSPELLEEERSQSQEDDKWIRWAAGDQLDIETDLKILRRRFSRNNDESVSIYKELLITSARGLEEKESEPRVPDPHVELTQEQPIDSRREIPLLITPQEPPPGASPREIEPLRAPQQPPYDSHREMAFPSAPLEPPGDSRTEVAPLGTSHIPGITGLMESILPPETSAEPIQDVTVIRAVGLRAGRDPYVCPKVQPSESDKSLDLSLQSKREESEKTIRLELEQNEALSFADIFPETTTAEDRTIGFLSLLNLCQSRVIWVSQSSTSPRDILIRQRVQE